MANIIRSSYADDEKANKQNRTRSGRQTNNNNEKSVYESRDTNCYIHCTRNKKIVCAICSMSSFKLIDICESIKTARASKFCYTAHSEQTVTHIYA